MYEGSTLMIREKNTVKLSIDGHCPSHSKTDISIRDVSFCIDEPVARGGTNEGPTPTDTALAALVGCTNVIGHKCADKLGVDIGHLDIKAIADFDRRGVTLAEEIDVPFVSVTLEVISHGPASQSEIDQVANEVAKYCPLSKLFRSAGTVVNENWSVA